MNMTNPVSLDKASLRQFYIDRRKELASDKARKEALDTELQTRLLISPEYRSADSVLVYVSRNFEISTSMIIYAALANHKKVGLPVSLDDRRMIFREIESPAQLKPGRFGIPEPPDECPEITVGANTLCVCPALCCDMAGFRLGFGGGYYDRFLSDFKGISVALCYSDSLIPAIEHDEFDIPVDIIHTDNYSRYIS